MTSTELEALLNEADEWVEYCHTGEDIPLADRLIDGLRSALRQLLSDQSTTEEAAFKAGIGADYDFRKQEWRFDDLEGWAPEDVTNALASYRQSKAGSVK